MADTISELQIRLGKYLECESKILTGAQQYEVRDQGIHRVFTRAQLAEVRAAILDLQAQLAVARPANRFFRIM